MRRSIPAFTKKEVAFIKKNFNRLSNAEMARIFKMNYMTFANRVHELGLKKMELEYWTEEQTEFLKKNYRQIGDKELSEIFEERWPKNKAWSIKHIEKKRGYLGLKRSADDLKQIKKRNIKRGSWKNMSTWDTRGAMQTGSIRVWHFGEHNATKVIKTDKGFLIYSRWLYEKHFGKIPEGFIVTFKDGNPMNVVLDNLILVERATNARRYSASVNLTDNYVARMIAGLKADQSLVNLVRQDKNLIEIKRQQLLLNRTIKKITKNHERSNQ